MKFKPAMWAAASAPLLFLLLLVGGMRGFAYLRGEAASHDLDVSEPRYALAQQDGQKENNAPQVPLKPADKATTQALQKVIGGQIGALQKRDFSKAMSFASPPAHWPLSAFQQMIMQGYRELVDSKTVSYGTARIAPDGETAFVSVSVKNVQKQEAKFMYILTRDTATGGEKNKAKKDAPWHVSGCSRESPAPPTAPRSLNEA